MDLRRRLCEEEDVAWAKLCELLDRLSPEELEDPTLAPEGWSPKDLMFHVGGWLADCGRQLERMRAGTFVDPQDDTEAVNAEWFELSKTLDLDTVRAEFVSARTRMLHEFGELPEVSAVAQEWFEESGAIHYHKHIEDLERWMSTRGR